MTPVLKVQIDSQGGLEGIRVVGFHGEVEPARTPARLQAVLADETGHLVRLDRVEEDEQAIPRAAWLRKGNAEITGRLPGVATRLDPPCPAILGHVVIVVGRDERAEVSRLRASRAHADEPSVDRFLHWLSSNEPSGAGLQVWRLGKEAVAWYCKRGEAVALFERIRQTALDKLVGALAEDRREDLYRYSWWLSRSALDDTDLYLAAAGLERCDPGMADALLSAAIHHRTREQVKEELLEKARRRLDVLLEEHHEAQRGQIDLRSGAVIGRRLLKVRSEVRTLSMIPRKAAA